MVLQRRLPEPLPHRDTLKSWFAEAGYLYLIVVALVVAVFLLGELFHARGAWGPSAQPAPPASNPGPYPAEVR